MDKKIDFEHIDFTNTGQQQQDEHKIYFYVKQNSKKISIETEFIYQELSGIEIKNKYPNEYKTYSNTYDKISNIIVILNNDQTSCKNLKNILTYYDEKLDSSKENILGRFGKLHLIQCSVCTTKSLDEYCVFNLDIGWNYYLKETRELLSVENSQIIKNKTIKFYSENKDKTKEEKKELIKSLEFELEFTDNNKNKINKKVLMSEILNKKDRIDTEVYIRKLQNITDVKNVKKPNECNESELLMFYGKPEKIDVRTLGEFLKIYKNNSYVKFYCDILNGYINKHVVDDEKKRKIGLQYIIRAIEIIKDDSEYDTLNSIDKFDNNYNYYNNDIKKNTVYLFGKRK